MDFNKLAQEINQINQEKGWNDLDRRPLEIIALIHSEISEATDALINNEKPIWYQADGKPEGEYIEICDAIIRTLGYLAFENSPRLQKLGDLIHLTIANDNFKAMVHVLACTKPTLEYCSNSLLHYSLDTAVEQVRTRDDYHLGLMSFVIACCYYLRTKYPEINFEKTIREKIEYNKTRPYRHGNKEA